MNHLKKSSTISVTQPSLLGKPRVDLDKSDFDAIISQKGYRVYHDKALKCPCRNIPDSQGLSNCRNCGGSGWVFVNRSETKMVVQSMNRNTKFLEWSEEKLGTAKITKRNEEDLGYMDKLTLIDVLSIHNEIVFPKTHSDGKLRGACIYEIKEVQMIYAFNESSSILDNLTLGVDYSIEQGNYLTFSDKYLQKENFTITIRYKHNPIYHVIDFSRGYMNTFVQDKSVGGIDTSVEMPLSAVGRLAHYILNEQHFNEDFILDNTIISTCETTKVNIGGIIQTVPVISEDQKGDFQRIGIIIFNQTTNGWEGWNGTEWVAIDNKIADLWSSTNK